MEPTDEPIRILHVDDEPDFTDAVGTFLERQDDRFTVETSTHVPDALDRLTGDGFDCVVSDFEMPDRNGIEFLQNVRELDPNLPFILCTGKGSEEIASDAISAGVTDYLQKDSGTTQFTVLANRIQNAVEKYRAEAELADRERRLNLFFEQSPLGVIEWNEQFEAVRLNGSATDILGYTEADLVGHGWHKVVPESDRDAVEEVVADLLENKGGYHSVNENIRKNGDRIVCEWHNRVVTDETDEVVAVFSQFQDITERKRTEEAFTLLYETAHDLLSATSEAEIADIAVDAASEILDLPHTVLFRFESTENAFVPLASSPSLAAAVGTPPTIPADERSLTGETFFEETLLTVDDITTAETVYEPEFPVRKAVFIPLGEHGVLVAGGSEAGTFGSQRRSVAELLGTTVRSAFARLSREQALEERQWELEEQTEQLERINDINELIRGINEQLVGVNAASEIEQVVCDHLVAQSQYGFAWIGEYNPTNETVTPRTWAGSDRGYLDAIDSVDAPENEMPYPAKQTAQSGELTVIPNIADGLRNDQWRRESLSRGFQSALGIPLQHGEIPYGILTVYATSTEAFDPLTRTVFEELGEMIADAIHSVETRQKLTAESVIELKLVFRDVAGILPTLAERVACSLSVEAVLPQGDDQYLAFVAAPAAEIEEIEAVAGELSSVSDLEVISTDDDRVMFEVTVSDPPVAHTVAEHGAVPQTVTTDGERLDAAVEVPTSTDVRAFVEQLQTKYPDIELVARHRRERPAETREPLGSIRSSDLTDRQREVLKVAYHSGYFNSPRQRTGAEVADSLGITQPTFTYHLRRALEKLVESELGPTTTSSSLDT